MSIIPEEFPAEIKERLRDICEVPFAKEFGLEVLSITSDEVRVAMDISDKRNALDNAHGGGAVFTLADQAFAIATNMGPYRQVGISASINYLRPAKGRLVAVARKLGETRRTTVVEVLIYDGDNLVAIFNGTGYKLQG